MRRVTVILIDNVAHQHCAGTTNDRHISENFDFLKDYCAAQQERCHRL